MIPPRRGATGRGVGCHFRQGGPAIVAIPATVGELPDVSSIRTCWRLSFGASIRSTWQPVQVSRLIRGVDRAMDRILRGKASKVGPSAPILHTGQMYHGCYLPVMQTSRLV